MENRFSSILSGLPLPAILVMVAVACTQQQAPVPAKTANADIAKKAHALFSQNKFDEVAELVTDDIRVMNMATGEVFNGKAEFRQFMTGFKTAFPDLVLNEKNSFESGAQVALEFDGVGTHTGPLVGPGGTIAATGRPVKLPVCEVMRIENGKIAAITNYQDSGSLMAQLGVGQAPAQGK